MTALLLAALFGYLVGSVSASRIVAARVLPGEQIETTTYALGRHGFRAEVRGHSPGAVGRRAGARAGGMATLGDIAKAAVAVGVAWLVLDRDAAAAAGVGAVLGHAAPLYHRFRGAFGQSPIIGATLLLHPLGLLAAIAASIATAVATAEAIWAAALWPVFLVPFALLVGDTALTWFAVAANVVYLCRSAPSVVQRVRYRREHAMSRADRARELRETFGTRASSFRDRDRRDEGA